jgi:ABC-type Fe3+/spermidine/putrescine transport system ATPase subunit
MAQSLLSIRGVSKTFEDHLAVDAVDLDVAVGEIVCLLGPSGCGKTTLLRSVAGLVQPDAGDVWFDGLSMAGVPPHKRDFGMMFQDFALFPHKNVFDNVAFGLKMRGDSAELIHKRVTEMLELVDLARYADRRIENLSGGEQQRVALARSLAPGPRLLMLDEPLGALDRALRERLMLDLRRILKQVDVTSIYVTHDQTEAYAIADRIVIMNAGHIEQIATPTELYFRPKTAFVARFLGFRNVIAADIDGTDVVVNGLGRFQLGVDSAEFRPKFLLIKPNAISDIRPADGATLDTNQITGVVDAIAFRGRYYQLWLRCNDFRCMFECPELDGIALGDHVTGRLDPDQLSVLAA